MATTRLMPLRIGKGRSVAEVLGRVTDYVENPEKTNGGELVTAYQCNPTIADQEFLFSKRQYATITGRNQKGHDIIAYHLRQSFKPGEITPELANKIGYDLAMSLTKGKHLAFKIPGGKRFIRCDSLGDDYSEAAIMERISGKRIVTPKEKQAAPNLLIDIQAKLQQAHSPGFEKWAKVTNLKEAAKTLNFLREYGLMDFSALEQACNAATERYHSVADRTKANSARMQEIAQLQKHIGTYSKTRDVYAQYRKLPPKKQAGFYAEHTSEIISCEVAKKFFSSLSLKKLPSIQSLKQEYATLLAENKKLYPEQKKAKAEMMELLTVRHNTMRILGLTEQDARRGQRQEER